MARLAYIEGDPTRYRVLFVRPAYTGIDAHEHRLYEYPARALVEYGTRRGGVVRHFVELGLLRPWKRLRLRPSDSIVVRGHACIFLRWVDLDRDIALVEFANGYTEHVNSFEIGGQHGAEAPDWIGRKNF